MSDIFIDPVEALADLDTKIAPTGLQVWIDRVKAIALPVVRSYTFTQGELDGLHEARTIIVNSKDSQRRAWEVLKAIKATRKNATTWYETLRKPFRDVASAIIDLESRDAVPIADAERALGDKIRTYDDEQTRLERVERDRLQAIEDERVRVEQQRSAETMMRLADAQTDDNLKGAFEREAVAIAQTPVAAPRVSVPTQRAQVKGVGFTTTYTGEVTNKRAFIKAVASGKISLDAVEMSQAWVNAKVRELKEQTPTVYPFIKVIKDRPTRG